MKDLDLSKFRLGDSPLDDSFAQGQRNAALRKQNEAALTELVELGIITEEQSRKLTGYSFERTQYQIEKIRAHVGVIDAATMEQMDREAGNYFYRKNREDEARSKPQLVPQFPFDDKGQLTTDHIRATLREQGIDPDTVAMRYFSPLQLPDALSSGQDRTDSNDPRSHIWDTIAPAIKRYEQIKGRTLGNREMTFISSLKGFNNTAGAGSAAIIYRFTDNNGQPLWDCIDQQSALYTPKPGHSFLDLAVAVFHANAPRKSVPTTGKHTHEPEPPIKGADLPRDQQPDLPS